MPYIGFHQGNYGQDIDNRAKNVVEYINPKAFLFMDNILPDAPNVRNWVSRNYHDAFVVLRKHFHADGKPANRQRVLQWAEDQANMIDLYLRSEYFRKIYEDGRLGVKVFNEPNMPIWAQYEGFGDNEEGMRLYSEMFPIAVEYIKNRFPNVKIVGYSLTPGNRDVYFKGDTQYAHYWTHGPECAHDNPTEKDYKKARESCLLKETWQYMDWLGVHVYPLPGTWNEAYLGRRFEKYWKTLPEHLVNNTFILEASVADAAGQEERAKQTYFWLEMLRKEYPQIKAVTLWWLRNGDPKWEKHFYTEPDGTFRPVVHSVKRFIDNYGVKPKEESQKENSRYIDDRVLQVFKPRFEFLDENDRLESGEYFKINKVGYIENVKVIRIYVKDKDGSFTTKYPIVVDWVDDSIVLSPKEDGYFEYPLFAKYNPDKQEGPYKVYVHGFQSDVVHGLGAVDNTNAGVLIEFSLKYIEKEDHEKPIGPPVEEPINLEEEIREIAWGKLGIQYNKNAYLYKYALSYELGAPLSNEFDVSIADKTFRVQLFSNGIVFAPVVNGIVSIQNTNHIDWE